MEHKSNNVALAEAAYANALEAGEVGEQDKEAVIIGALWALSKVEPIHVIMNTGLHSALIMEAMERASEDQRSVIKGAEK